MNENLDQNSRNATQIISLHAFAHPRVITMLFLGFSAGLPLWLIFSSLSLWLREAGVDRTVVTFFSWAALGYSFKFVWAPIVDNLPLPILTNRLGRRRSWILFAQVLVILAIVLMSSIDPAENHRNLGYLALAAVMLGFSSATQDIVIDAYRIESAELNLQALMSSTYIAGYRIGLLVSGAGALFLAGYFGSTPEFYSYDAWRYTYLIMAVCMLVGVITTLIISEPKISAKRPKLNSRQCTRIVLLFTFCVLIFISTYLLLGDSGSSLKTNLLDLHNNKALAGFLVESFKLAIGVLVTGVIAMMLTKSSLIDFSIMENQYLNPIKDFFNRYGFHSALLLLSLVGLYRISDIVLGVIANVFYQDLGYTKNEIAAVAKTFGLLAVIIGGFVGGLLSLKFGVMRVLLLGAILSAGTNLLFMLLAESGYSLTLLYLVIGADNLSAGIASAAFVAFLSALTNIKFTATQFAIFTSLMTLIPKVLGGYSGSIVDELGYSQFFLVTALLGLPVIILILVISRNSKFFQ